MSSWRAWHVFIADRANTDRFLLEVVAPEIARLATVQQLDRWFFIRYWENGPHIRLRVDGADDQTFLALGSHLRQHAPEYAASDVSADTRFDPAAKFDGWHADPSAVPWFGQGEVHEIAYEPELRRYGGPNGLQVAEALFGLSSETAIRVVGATAGDFARTETIALHLTVATLMAVTPDYAARIDFLDRMAASWRGFAPDAMVAEQSAREQFLATRGAMQSFASRLTAPALSNEHWSPFVLAYAAAVRAGLAELRKLASAGQLISPVMGIPTRNDGETEAAIKSIALSLIHMMNNRLGMTPLHEYRFAQMLVWASENAALEPVA